MGWQFVEAEPCSEIRLYPQGLVSRAKSGTVNEGPGRLSIKLNEIIERVIVAIKVEHLPRDSTSTMSKETLFNSSSWTVAEGHLTIGDYQGSPEASFAPGSWFNVVKVDEDRSVDDE